MILLATGAFLFVLGLLSGAALVLGPLGLVPWSSGAVLWVLFPLFSIVGFVLVAMAGREAQVRSFTFAVSCLLLLLALASATGVFLAAASLITPRDDTLSLWYVLAVAGVLGAIGAASSRPATETA